jgi:hypothetical protein
MTHNGKVCNSSTKERYFYFYKSLETLLWQLNLWGKEVSCTVLCSSQLLNKTNLSHREVERKTRKREEKLNKYEPRFLNCKAAISIFTTECLLWEFSWIDCLMSCPHGRFLLRGWWWDQTQGLDHCKQEMYHWATLPASPPTIKIVIKDTALHDCHSLGKHLTQFPKPNSALSFLTTFIREEFYWKYL